MKNKNILIFMSVLIIIAIIVFFVIKQQTNPPLIEKENYLSDLNNCMELPVSEDAREGFTCIRNISAIAGKLEFCEKIKDYALNDYTEANYNVCINEVNKANYLKDNSVKEDILSSNNPNYTIILDNLILCNSEFAGGSDDSCFGYQYYNRGCYYASNLKTCPGYAGTYSNLVNVFGLTVNEANDICNRLLHPGLTANCLKNVDSNNGVNQCISFAKGDSYLLAICNLKSGEELSFEPRKISDFS